MKLSATLLTFSFLTLTLAALPATTALRAQSVAPPALAGQVASVEEGAMEGVLVTARKTERALCLSASASRARFVRDHDARRGLRPGGVGSNHAASIVKLETIDARPTPATGGR